MIDRVALEIRKRKGIRQCKRWWYKNPTEKAIGKAGTTPVPCSCFLCGNPRKHWKALTLQEIKANLPDEYPGCVDEE